MANYKTASVTVLANATGTQTISSSGSGTKMLWTEVSDQTNYGAPATHMTSSVFTAPYAGFYQLAMSLSYGSGDITALTQQYVTIIKNANLASGIILLSGTHSGGVQNVSRVFALAKGDTLAVYVNQTNAGGTTLTIDNVNSILSIVRLSNAS
jgi:hypothetical protein